MKKRISIMLVLAVFFVTSVAIYSFGDSSDPLISKSYLDKTIEELKAFISGEDQSVKDELNEKINKNEESISSIDKRVEKLEKEGVPTNGGEAANNQNSNSNENESTDPSEASSSDKFKPIMISRGQKLIFGEGTEFILRSGVAKVIDESGNGLPDLTNAGNLMSGDSVPLNHLSLSPRDDGRGIECMDEVSWLMIKGDYTLLGEKNSNE